MLRRVRLFDWLVVGNAVLLAVVIGTVYYPELGGYVGGAGRYFAYLALFIAFAVPVWALLRRFDYPAWLLVALQVGILAHYAGGGLEVDAARLYDQIVLGVRFDKYVHFYNSLIGALGIRTLMRRGGLSLGSFEPLILVGFTLGLGGVVEMLEYAGYVIAGSTGMGDYANNMGDLLANLAGSTTAVVGAGVVGRLRR